MTPYICDIFLWLVQLLGIFTRKLNF